MSKLCPKCNAEIPKKITIDNKIRNLHKRKYCLDCSPFGTHNTIALENKRSDGKKLCPKCQQVKEYSLFYFRKGGHRCSAYCIECNNNRPRKPKSEADISKPKEPKIVTEETRRIISEKRKKWLAENPERHPWRQKDRHKSKPCESVKEYLKTLNMVFVEEYLPQINDRHFSIDIAFPDRMIALEINGNQHYNSDGSLLPYYQERHDLLESAGWKVYEVHYSCCFKFKKWEEFKQTVLDSEIKKDFDYFNYTPRSKRDKSLKSKIYTCSCGQPSASPKGFCMECHRTNLRKDWPAKETLRDLMSRLPFTKIALMFGVSDNTVKKWAVTYELEYKKLVRKNKLAPPV